MIESDRREAIVIELKEIFEYLSDLDPIICSITASLFTYLAACHKTNKEIKKLKLEWSHSRQVQFDADFANMVNLVNQHLSNRIGYDSGQVYASIGIVRSGAPDELVNALNNLEDHIASGRLVLVPDALNHVIDTKRNINF